MRLLGLLSLSLWLLAEPLSAAAIHDAAKKGDTEAVIAAIEAGESVNADDGQAGPLYYAADGGHEAVAKLLIARGADVNFASKRGAPITIAAWKKRGAILKLLLDHGADPNSDLSQRYAPSHGLPKGVGSTVPGYLSQPARM